MKIFLLSLLVAAAFAAPAPLEEDTGEAVELIVNGVDEGEPLEIGDVLGIKVKEHVDGEILSASDLLFPLTAAGIQEAAADDIPEPVDVVEVPEIDNPKPAEPALPEVNPEENEVVEPSLPEVNPEENEVVKPNLPEVAPEENEIVEPILPEFETPIDAVPEPAPQLPTGEIFNNGMVQVTLNTPEPGVISTVQSWFNLVINYFNGSVTTTNQIV